MKTKLPYREMCIQPAFINSVDKIFLVCYNKLLYVNKLNNIYERCQYGKNRS